MQVARAQAQLNRVDTFTPFGEVTFGGEFRNRANVTLSPEQQQLFDLQNQMGIDAGEAGAGLAGQLTGDAFTLPGDAPTAGSADEATQAAFTRGMNLLSPQFQQQEDRTVQRLADMGLPVGSEAFNTEMDRIGRGRSEAMENLALSSVQSGQDVASSQLARELQARRNMIGERQLVRQQPINELSTLMGLGQMQMPQQVGAQPVDVTGPFQMQQNQQNMAWQANQQRQQSMRTGLMSMGGALGSAAMMSSSRRIKTDEGPAETILDRLNALPIRAWRYNNPPPGLEGTQVGPYAEDFRDVFGIGDGHSVPTVSAIGICMAAIQDLSRRVEALNG